MPHKIQAAKKLLEFKCKMSSTDVTVTPVDSVMDSIKALSFMELVALQVLLATHVKSESKKTVKSTKAKDPSAPKRVAGPAFLAFGAFKKHLQETQPALFEGVPLMKRGAIVSAYRAEHEAEYDAFKDNFIATYNPSAPVEKTTKKVKVPKAKKEEAVAPVVTEAPVVAEKPKKEKKAKKADVEAPAEKPKKEKKAKKEADVDKPKPTKAKASSKWAKIEQDGVTFFHNTVDNTVWDINDDSPTEQIGTWNPTTSSIEFMEME
jgi:hypothetical protein